MRLPKIVSMSLFAFAALAPNAIQAKVTEPPKVASPAKLKPGEGAVRLSVRTQKQFTETFFLYFVRLDESGNDSDTHIRIERGAGVPIAGSNMIDVKPVIYRMPVGRYRLLGYTMRCEGVPFEGALCSGSISGPLPTGYYKSPAPTFEVKDGSFADVGDFILEYTGPRPMGEIIGIAEVDEHRSDIRWKPITAPKPAAFASLADTGPPTIPALFQSRITCKTRPKGVMLYIPFTC
jgi:hypothetical protein